jgi:hypothetical protein
VKILTAINLAGDLDRVAMRGARYGFPGWVTVEETKRGAKRRYIDQRADAQAKAVEYLAGATTAGELAGRTLALVVMAVYADEHAVANSNRAFHTVTVQTVLPWAGEVCELIDELAAEKLPTALMDPVLEPRRADRAERRAAHAAQAAATERIAELLRDRELDAQALDELEQLNPVAYGEYSTQAWELREKIRARRTALESGDTGEAPTDPGRRRVRRRAARRRRAAAGRHDSTLRWLQTPTLALLQALLGGRIAVTHRALDIAATDAHTGRAVGYMRAALVDAGVLEARDEHSAAFERWQQRAVDAVTAGPDRGHVRAYASWHVATNSRTPARAAARPRRLRNTLAAWSARRSSSSAGCMTSSWSYATCAKTSSMRGSPTAQARAAACACSCSGWRAPTPTASCTSPGTRAEMAPRRLTTSSASRPCAASCTTGRAARTGRTIARLAWVAARRAGR